MPSKGSLFEISRAGSVLYLFLEACSFSTRPLLPCESDIPHTIRTDIKECFVKISGFVAPLYLGDWLLYNFKNILAKKSLIISKVGVPFKRRSSGSLVGHLTICWVKLPR